MFSVRSRCHHCIIKLVLHRTEGGWVNLRNSTHAGLLSINSLPLRPAIALANKA